MSLFLYFQIYSWLFYTNIPAIDYLLAYRSILSQINLRKKGWSLLFGMGRIAQKLLWKWTPNFSARSSPSKSKQSSQPCRRCSTSKWLQTTRILPKRTASHRMWMLQQRTATQPSRTHPLLLILTETSSRYTHNRLIIIIVCFDDVSIQ